MSLIDVISEYVVSFHGIAVTSVLLVSEGHNIYIFSDEVNIRQITCILLYYILIYTIYKT